MREETTELVWAIEVTALGGAAGTVVDRSAEARPRYRGLPATATPATGEPVQFDYYARTDVEENWYAFGLPFPTAAGGRGVLMPYVVIPAIDGTARPAPWGAVLGDQLNPSVGPVALAQEEVTREGRQVARVWRTARWTDGSHLAWVARRTELGRGEATSGLSFDLAR